MERKDETSCPRLRNINRVNSVRPYVILNPEMLIPTMNFGGVGIRVDGLETDTELADFGQIFRFGTFADPTYSPNIFFIEPCLSG